MKSTIEIYDSVLETLLNQDYFSNFKYRKKDKNFIKKRKDGFDAIELQVNDYFDLKRDGRAVQITPFYYVRFDILHKWFEKYSFKSKADQQNNYILLFSGEDFSLKRDYYFLLNEENYNKDLEQFLLDLVSNAKFFFSQFNTLEAVYNNIIPPILNNEKEFPDGQADWIFEYLTLCRIVAPNNYEKLKKLIFKRIEFILAKPYKDVNIMYYYPRINEIIEDLESQF